MRLRLTGRRGAGPAVRSRDGRPSNRGPCNFDRPHTFRGSARLSCRDGRPPASGVRGALRRRLQRRGCACFPFQRGWRGRLVPGCIAGGEAARPVGGLDRYLALLDHAHRASVRAPHARPRRTPRPWKPLSRCGGSRHGTGARDRRRGALRHGKRLARARRIRRGRRAFPCGTAVTARFRRRTQQPGCSLCVDGTDRRGHRPLSARRCARAGVRRGEEQPRKDRFSPSALKPCRRRLGETVTLRSSAPLLFFRGRYLSD
jgi:hypothetical protein